MKFWKALAFGIIVTLAMNALDMLYHTATDTAVHLGYVAVKFVIVFASVFLIALFIGRGRTQGIVTSLLGPIAFYIYYSFASPTLDRSIFVLDEAVWYVVVHAAALSLMYLLCTGFVMKKNASKLSIALLTALSALPLYWGWRMLLVLLAGGLAEETTTVLSFGTALLSLAILFALVYIAILVKDSLWSGVAAGVVFGVFGMLAGATVIDAIARVLIVAVPYFLVQKLRGAS